MDADLYKESKYVLFLEKKYLYHHEKCIHKSLLYCTPHFLKENLDTAKPPMLSAWGQPRAQGRRRHRPHRYEL